MTYVFTIVYQAVLAILLILNAVNVASLPPMYQHAITEVIPVLQGLQAVLAHMYTPQGRKLSTKD